MKKENDLDVILVGGGLASSLVALKLFRERPEISFLILERGATLGGDHTWSFHTTDVSTSSLAWISPLIDKSWYGHTVRFPAYERSLSGGYHSLRSEKLHETSRPYSETASGQTRRSPRFDRTLSGWTTGLCSPRKRSSTGEASERSERTR